MEPRLMPNFKNIQNETRFSAEKMQKVTLFETKNFFCDVYGLEPGQEQKAHSHAGSDKIYCVIEGSATFIVDDKTRQAASGDVVSLHREARTAYAIHPTKGWSCWC